MGGEAVRLAGVADRRVHHGLFVAALVVGHLRGVLQQRLAEAGDVAVAEDAPGGADEPPPDAVALGVLGGEETDQRLCDGQAGGHRYPSVWSGWKQIRHSLVSPGPAMTFR